MPSLPNWTTPAKRRPGWERSYVEIVQHHMALPVIWGESDCLTVPADLCEGMCGRNPFPTKLRRYSTELGAAKLMRRLGFETVEDALAGVFPRVSKTMVRRGDCGVFESILDGRPQLACLIVLHDGTAAGKGIAGPVRVPVSRLKSTFAIGVE